MYDFKIITDSGCDLSAEGYARLDVHCVPLSVEFKGQVNDDRNDDSLKDFYNGLREGEHARTSAVNPETWKDAMVPYLKEGKDVLVMTFSSGLSTTAQSAMIAADELGDKFPERKILVCDTLCASMGQGLLVWYACHRRDEGASLEEVFAWVEENKQNLCHWFTVDDLFYLKRGGRISGATALVGTMLNIKPVLHVDDEGHLVSVSKCRGRKAALNALVKKLETDGLPSENETIFISHGDCLEDAQYVADQVKALYGVKTVVIGYVGAVIGSHSGPGTVALFFLGKHR